MKIKGLIFDFDGTLATPSSLDFIRLNQELAEKAEGYVWPQEGYILERLAKLQKQLPAGLSLIDDLLQHITMAEIMAARESSLFAFTPQVLAQAEALGLKIAIVSRNSTPAIISVFEKARDYVFLPRDQVTWVKPDPRHFIQAAQAMNLPPSVCLAVGDHPMDMEGARAAGCLAVGVLSGLSGEEVLRSSGARHILPDISQLLSWLRADKMLDNYPPGSKF